MLDEPASIGILILNLILGIWFNSTQKAIDNLSLGKINKLDSDKQEELVKKAEIYLENSNGYKFTLRIFSYFNICCICCITILIGVGLMQEPSGFPLIPLFLSILVFPLGFIIITELISTYLMKYSWVVLNISFPFMKLCHILPAIFFAKESELLDLEDEDDTTTEEEIEALLDKDEKSHENSDNGMIEESTGKMIRGVLDLDETLVKEIMTPRVEMSAISIESAIDNVIKKIQDSGHSRIPIFTENIDDVIGIVYSKDILLKPDEELKNLMRKATFIPESKNVRDLLEEFQQTKNHIAIVIDEYGGTAGVVSLEDIIEEIVGEIADEFDEIEEEEIELKISEDGSLELEARTPIEDVNDVLNISLPEEEDNVTIGGYVISEIGRIPQAGECIVLGKIEATIIDANERKINTLKIKKTESKQKATN
ncbi:MAG: HlyC/CorC family transporter [Lentisphaeria bacterium]|nr:hemolysin family protein [Lentisphaeria bacterium]NQZ69689.1 HlyC/CorC family transporter [Lentisphaeria bacterium]